MILLRHSVVYKLVRVDNEYFIRLRIGLGFTGSGNFAIDSGEVILFVLDNGESFTLYNPESKSIYTYKHLVLKIDNQTMDLLSKYLIKKLSIITTEMLVDMKIKNKSSIILRQNAFIISQ